MAKINNIRINIILKCTECKNKKQNNNNNYSHNLVKFSTTKNRRNTPKRLELRKFCPKCNKHTLQKELK